VLKERGEDVKGRTLFASLIILLSIGIIRVEAASTITVLSVAPLTYIAEASGETFTLDVSVTDVKNLYAFEFKLSYNTTLLDALQVVQGPFFPPPPGALIDKLEINEKEGLIWVIISLSDSEPPKNGSGTLAFITLNVTYAPIPTTKACCVLNLHDTILYDDTMTPIVHYSIDGLYFWKSIFDDPDEVVFLDLTTQKGGTGPSEPSPPFTPGEMVELIARLTCRDVPQKNELVAFEVLDPNNETILVRSPQVTDNDGIAITQFKIPALPESLGTWKAIAVSKACGITVWDFLYFTVKPTAVGGHATPIEKTHLSTPQVGLYPFILVAIVMLIAVFKKMAKLSKIFCKNMNLARA